MRNGPFQWTQNGPFCRTLNGPFQRTLTVTKEMMNAIDQNPTITFKAYAVQYSDTEKTHFEPYEAWEQIPSNEK